jgi:hypothetical protein
MKSIAILFISVLVGNLPALAQSANRFSIQAGYLYSTSTFTQTTTFAIGLPNFDPKPGFYAGLTYEHQLSTLLTSGLELTYQQKGYISRIPYVNPASINTYRYLGITPMLGIRLIKNLRILLGPEVNLLVNKSTRGLETQPLTDANRRLEVGLVGRASYQFNRVGLTAGYFKGLTAYYKPDFYYLTNQNWQLGLFYQLNKNRSY